MIEEIKMFFKVMTIFFFSLSLLAEPSQKSYFEKLSEIKKQEEEKRIQKLKKVFPSHEEETKLSQTKKKIKLPSKKGNIHLENLSQKFSILDGYQKSIEKDMKNKMDQSYFHYENKSLEKKQKKESFSSFKKNPDFSFNNKSSILNSFSMKQEDLNRQKLEEQKNKTKNISDSYLNHTKNSITKNQKEDFLKQTDQTIPSLDLIKKEPFSLANFFQSYESEIENELNQKKDRQLSFFDYIFDKKWFKQALSLPEHASYEEVLNEFSWHLLGENNINFIFESLKPYSSKETKDRVYAYFDREYKENLHLSVLKDYLKNKDRSQLLTTGQIIETLNYTSRNRCNHQRILLAKKNDLWKSLNYSERALYINYLSSKYTEDYLVPENLLMCIVSRESHNLIPSLVNFTRCGNKSSTAVGLTQITLNTLIHLYRLKKYSLVEGFENEKSPFRIHDLFVVYPELQIERAMAILTYIKINKVQRDQLKNLNQNSRKAKNIYRKMLYNYYSHPCKARNDNYTKKVLRCYSCLQEKNKNFQDCLKKSMNTYSESKILKNACKPVIK